MAASANAPHQTRSRVDSAIQPKNEPSHDSQPGNCIGPFGIDPFHRSVMIVRSVARFGSALTDSIARSTAARSGALERWVDVGCAAMTGTAVPITTAAIIAAAMGVFE